LPKHLYIFSGLGADEKAFQRLDLGGYHVTYIRWVKPGEDETIETYAGRLIDQVISVRPVLIGLSFGGLMAIEIAKHIETEKIILISSAKTRHEIPLHLRIAGSLRLHRLIPYSTLKKPNVITSYLFGAHTREDKALLEKMLL
jgi:esterase/lipase